MSRKRFRHMNCAVAQALEVIGDWWTPLIIREAFYGTATFSQFRQNLGIARNILANRLARLVEAGVFRRKPIRRGVDRHTYYLTEKGHDLLPVLVALMQWGDKWVFGKGAEPVRILSAGDHKPIAEISVRAADGRKLGIQQLRVKPGPGADKRIRSRFQSIGRPANRTLPLS